MEERVRLLAELGQLSLALLTARTHGLTEFALELEQAMQQQGLSTRTDYTYENPAQTGECLLPPVPMTKSSQSNWPLTASKQSIFSNRWEGVASAGPVQEPALDLLGGDEDYVEERVESGWANGGSDHVETHSKRVEKM